MHPDVLVWSSCKQAWSLKIKTWSTHVAFLGAAKREKGVSVLDTGGCWAGIQTSRASYQGHRDSSSWNPRTIFVKGAFSFKYSGPLGYLIYHWANLSFINHLKEKGKHSLPQEAVSGQLWNGGLVPLSSGTQVTQLCWDGSEWVPWVETLPWLKIAHRGFCCRAWGNLI